MNQTANPTPSTTTRSTTRATATRAGGKPRDAYGELKQRVKDAGLLAKAPATCSPRWR